MNNNCDFISPLDKPPLKPTMLCDFFAPAARAGPWKIESFLGPKRKNALQEQAEALHKTFKAAKEQEVAKVKGTSTAASLLAVQQETKRKNSMTEMAVAAKTAMAARKAQKVGSF
jgi:hypothetical protein